MSFNAVDAAQSIADGVLGLIEEIKIGDLVISVLTGLDAPSNSIVTRKPVEAGYQIVDAMVDEPVELVMDICLTNPDFSAEAGVKAAVTGSVDSFTESWRDKKDRLYEIKNTKEIVEVQTHDAVYESMLLTNITPIYDVEDNSEAFFATVILVEYNQIGLGTSSSGGLLDAAKDAVGGL